MAEHKLVINEHIHFVLDDIHTTKLFEFLYNNGRLEMDCPWCGTTVIPQAKRYFSETQQNEFKVNCVNCGRSVQVRMYGRYGFVLSESGL